MQLSFVLQALAHLARCVQMVGACLAISFGLGQVAAGTGNIVSAASGALGTNFELFWLMVPYESLTCPGRCIRAYRLCIWSSQTWHYMHVARWPWQAGRIPDIIAQLLQRCARPACSWRPQACSKRCEKRSNCLKYLPFCRPSCSSRSTVGKACQAIHVAVASDSRSRTCSWIEQSQVSFCLQLKIIISVAGNFHCLHPFSEQLRVAMGGLNSCNLYVCCELSR